MVIYRPIRNRPADPVDLQLPLISLHHRIQSSLQVTLPLLRWLALYAKESKEPKEGIVDGNKFLKRKQSRHVKDTFLIRFRRRRGVCLPRSLLILGAGTLELVIRKRSYSVLVQGFQQIRAFQIFAPLEQGCIVTLPL